MDYCTSTSLTPGDVFHTKLVDFGFHVVVKKE
jgi:hypothetical protein